MGWLEAIFIYFLIWWVMLFTVLPMGVSRHEDTGKGYDAGAPRHPDLKRKLVLNTFISAGILLVIYILAETGIIDWHAWFNSGATP